MVKGFIKRTDLKNGSCVLCDTKKICDSLGSKFNEILKTKKTSCCYSGDYYEYLPLTMLKRRRF